MKNTHKLYIDVITKNGSKNESLEVTENGTYEAPEGIGYSPVKVNVPQTAESGTVKALLDATKSAGYLFYDYKGATVDGLISLNDTANVTTMLSMFYGCSNLTSIPELNTSNAKYMAGMFRNCSNLTTIPPLDTSNVTTTSSMFNGCSKLTSVPELDMSKAENTYYMFTGCIKLTSIGIYGFTHEIDITETALEHDAIVALLNQAGIAYSSGVKIKMGSAKLALLSDEEKAIATNKGWTLA